MNIGYHGVLEGTPSYGWTSCFQSSHVRFLHARGRQFTCWDVRYFSTNPQPTSLATSHDITIEYEYCNPRISLLLALLSYCHYYYYYLLSLLFLFIVLNNYDDDDDYIYIYIYVCVSKCIYQYIMIHIYMYPHDLSNISICPRHKKCLSPFNFSVFRRGRWVHHELHLGSGLGCHQEEFQQHGGDDRPEQLGRAVMKRSVAAWKRGSPTLKK